MAEAGRLDEGIDLLKDTLAVQQSMNAGLVRPTFLALLGEALWSAGRIDEGLETVSEGLAHAERTFQGGYVPASCTTQQVGPMAPGVYNWQVDLEDYSGRHGTQAGTVIVP